MAEVEDTDYMMLSKAEMRGAVVERMKLVEQTKFSAAMELGEYETMWGSKDMLPEDMNEVRREMQTRQMQIAYNDQRLSYLRGLLDGLRDTEITSE